MEESVEQNGPTSEISSEVVKKRIVSGAAILTIRTFFLQAISFISNILLTVFLNPAQYGSFFLVSAVVNFLAYFGDVGLAAALIQRKEQLTNRDLKTIFSIQISLVLLILILVIVFSPLIKSIYNLDQSALYLLWALALSLVISSLKTVPTVLMERKLEFNRIVIPEIVETIFFNVVTVYLAWKGFGVTSFTLGVLARGISGLIMTYLIQPWIPGFDFSKTSIRELLKFGIPYQLNVFLAMIKDYGMTLLLGVILSPSGIGLLGWAQKWAYAPLRFFMDQVIKVTFPAFARLQDNKQELSKAVSKSIFFVCLLVFPSLVILVLIAPSLIEIIPKYSKWNPALFALSILTISSALAAITTPLTNALSAIGKISLTFKLMIMWTTLTWIIVPPLSVMYGLNGAAIGFSLVGLSSIVALFLTSKYVKINYLESVGKPILASILMGLLVLVIRSLIPVSLVQVIAMIMFGGVAYFATIFTFEPSLVNLIKTQFKKLKND